MRPPRWRQVLEYGTYSLYGVFALSLVVYTIKKIFFTQKDAPVIISQEVVSAEPSFDALPQSVSFPSPLLVSIPATPANPRKRVLTAVSALVLVATIGGLFFLSVRSYSNGLLAHASGVAGQSPTTTKSGQSTVLHAMLERGIIYPQWSPKGYGTQDSTWQQGVATMKAQTGAQWIEIPVLFSQASSSATVVGISQSAPTVEAFSQGIQRAHDLGYSVFFVPLMQVRQSGDWSGSITFQTPSQEQAWFASYWNTIKPYVVAAQNNHVEQMAIGTELQILQRIAPDSLWNQLISNVRGVFKQALTYDMNWSSLGQPMPDWLKNSALTYIGVSTYIPLVDTPVRVDPQQMPALWHEKIQTQLDMLSTQLGKQVLISEIGYRDSADALYQTWLATSKANADAVEQAGAYDAALSNVFKDTHIVGTFFWGWSDVGQFAIAGQPATQTLLKWYTLKQS